MNNALKLIDLELVRTGTPVFPLHLEWVLAHWISRKNISKMVVSGPDNGLSHLWFNLKIQNNIWKEPKMSPSQSNKINEKYVATNNKLDLFAFIENHQFLQDFYSAFVFSNTKIFRSSNLFDLMTKSREEGHFSFTKFHLELTEEDFDSFTEVLHKSILLKPVKDVESKSNWNGINLQPNVELDRIIEGLQSVIDNLSIGQNELLEALEIYKKNVRNELEVEYEQNYASTINLINKTEAFICVYGHHTPSKPGLLSFSAPASEAYQQFVGLTKMASELCAQFQWPDIVKFISLDDILHICEKAVKSNQEWHLTSMEVIQKRVKRLNPYHSLASFSVTLDEISKQYELINSFNIFSKTYGLNAQNFDIIISTLQADIEDLKSKLQTLLWYESQKEWTDFIMGLKSEHQKQIKALQESGQEDWMNEITRLFEQNLIHQHMHPILYQINSDNRRRAQRVLFDAENYLFSLPWHWESQSSLENDEANYTIMDTEGEKESLEVILKEDQLLQCWPLLKPIQEVAASDKYSMVSALAAAAMPYMQNLKIFQTRDENIISVLPPAFSSKIFSKLQPIGIKEIRMQDGKKNLLIEGLLTEGKRNLLFLADEILALDQYNEMLQQLYAITAFEKLGYEVRSINTLDFFKNGEPCMDDFLSIIVIEK